MKFDRAKETADFDAKVAQMAKRLSAHGVFVEKKEYFPEAFGCWHLVGGTDRKKFDFSYDGKDSILMYHDTAIVPKDYRDVQQRRFRTQEGEDPLAFAEEVLVSEFHTA
jgi:hypothetical protein